MAIDNPAFHKFPPPPHNLPSLIPRVKGSGDNVFRPVHDFLFPRIVGHVEGLGLPDDAQDVAQETLVRIWQEGLAKFDPYNGLGAVATGLCGWTFRNAEWIAFAHLRSANNPRVLPPTTGELTHTLNTSGRSLPEEQIQVIETIKSHFAQVLNKRQMRIVDELFTGKSYDTIAEELGVNKHKVEKEISEARKKVEHTFLFPHGYKRVASYDDKLFSNAVSRGSVKGVLCLGIWYVDDDEARRYYAHNRRALAKRVSQQNLIPLGSAVSYAEYRKLLTPRYRHLLVPDAEGNFHISPDVLERFRMLTNRPKRKPHRAGSTGIPLTEAASTQSEYDKLLRAISQGKVRTTLRGKRHLITRDEYQRFRRENGLTGLPPNGTIYQSSKHRNGNTSI